MSYQAPISGAPQILREIVETESNIRRTGYGEGSLAALNEEAFGKSVDPYGKVEGTIPKDPVAIKVMEATVGPSSPSKHFFSTGSPPSPVASTRKDLLRRLQSKSLDNDYLPALIQGLTAALDLGNEKHLGAPAYRDIDTMATSLVSELLARGFADSFLRFHVTVLERANLSEYERVNRFMSRLIRDLIPVEVILKVQASPDYWEGFPSNGATAYRSAKEIDCLASEWDKEKNNALRDGLAPESDLLRYIHLSLAAHDHHAATREAYHIFHKTADLMTVEFPRVTAKVVQAATVRSGDTWTAVNVVDASQMQLEPVPAVQTSKVLKDNLTGFASRFVQSVEQGTPRRQVEGSLRYFRISLEESWLESGLTNLWTSLETLAPQGSSYIIDRVAGAVAPLMGSFKVRTMTEILIGYLLRYGIAEKKFYDSVLGAAKGPDGLIAPHLLLRLLADHSSAVSLASKVQDSPLLVYRIMTFHKKVETGGALAKTVHQTTSRVDWQVRRLYRLRNDIVHGAASPENLQRLTQHLQLYALRLILAVSSLLEPDNGVDNVDSALSVIESSYHNWVDSMREAGGSGSRFHESALKELSPGQALEIVTPPFERYLLI